MGYLPARKHLAERELNKQSLEKILSTVLPKKNNYGPLAADELIGELRKFEVHTEGRFRKLMKKWRRRLIWEDQVKLSLQEISWYANDIGADKVRDMIRRQYWFAYPAFVRFALELEYGDRYENFARLRDAV
jgi:hypothetical protein